MRAVVVHGAGKLRVDEVDRPETGADGVLVRVAFGGICGSDLHYDRHGRNGIYELQSPLVLGLEIVGRVEEVGPDVAEDLRVGTPVAIHPATPTPPPGGRRGKACTSSPEEAISAVRRLGRIRRAASLISCV